MIFIVASCAPARKIQYFSNINQFGENTEQIKNKIDPKIQIDDLLSISVITLNPESNLLFNSGVMQTSISNSNTGITTKVNDGYVVNKSGEINFPVIGFIKIAGLTKEEATIKLTKDLNKFVKNPVVNIRYLNFKVTVVGEVNRPATFTVPTERVNLIEAIGLAGDLTVYGRRENVLIIREKDGARSTIRVDLTDKNILNSPYFYLQQNDIIYIEPVKARTLQASSTNYYVPLVSIGVSILSLLVIFLKLG